MWTIQMSLNCKFCSSAFGSARPFFLFLTAPIQHPVWAAKHPRTFHNTDYHTFPLPLPPHQPVRAWASHLLSPTHTSSYHQALLVLFLLCYTDTFWTKSIKASRSNCWNRRAVGNLAAVVRITPQFPWVFDIIRKEVWLLYNCLHWHYGTIKSL